MAAISGRLRQRRVVQVTPFVASGNSRRRRRRNGRMICTNPASALTRFAMPKTSYRCVPTKSVDKPLKSP